MSSAADSAPRSSRRWPPPRRRAARPAGPAAARPAASVRRQARRAPGRERDREDQDGGQKLGRRMVGEPGGEQGLAHDHRVGGPAEHRAAQQDDRGKAVDQADHQVAAPDDDRHADGKPEQDQQHAAGGGAADRQHVVDAHDGIGDDDGAQRHGKGGGGHRGGVVAGRSGSGVSSLRAIQTRAIAPASMKPGRCEDIDHHDGHQAARGDGAEGAPEDDLALRVPAAGCARPGR